MSRRWTTEDLKVAQSKTATKAPKQSKYKNKAVMYNGYKFDSMRERDRYIELWVRLQAKEIRHLGVQHPFALTVNDMLICQYIADFVYEEKIGIAWVARVEDSKGHRTAEYRLKKKLMRACLGIEILET